MSVPKSPEGEPKGKKSVFTTKPKFPNPLEVMQNKALSMETRKDAINQIIEEDQPDAAKNIYESIKEEPELLSPNALQYWGERVYVPAVPFVQEILGGGGLSSEFVYNAIYALAVMEEGLLNEYIHTFYKKSDEEKKYYTLLAVYDAKNENLNRLFLPICERIVFSKNTNEKTLSLALDFILANKEKIKVAEKATQQENYFTQDETFLYNKREEPSASSQGTVVKNTLGRVQAKRNPPLSATYSDTGFERQDDEQDKEQDDKNVDIPTSSPKKSFKDNKKSTASTSKNIDKKKKELEDVLRSILMDPDSVDAKTFQRVAKYFLAKHDKSSINKLQNLAKKKNKQSYIQKIEIALTERFGKVRAKKMIGKINQSLISYSYTVGPELNFLVRSYQKYFGKLKLSYEATRLLIKKGLKVQGSLKAILENNFREFRDDSHRAFNIASLFHITNSEARLLIRIR